MNETMVEIKQVTKAFDEGIAVNNLNLTIRAKEFITILGPSGCGKTTTLRMIAGFETPTSGEIWLSDKEVGRLEPYQRDVNTVFQSYSLFPHMTVFQNVAFGLKMKKMKKDQIAAKVKEALALVQLESFADRSPKQLSGGQQQRVAIARAIVNDPKVLLLDEPLGALDLKLRKQMQLELKQLQQRLGITFVYVTHDQEEALTMSDRIVVMNKGEIEQLGTPQEIYEHPRTPFVASFIGEANVLSGEVQEVQVDHVVVAIGDMFVIANHNPDVKKGDEILFSIRPENVQFYESNATPFTVSATLQEIIYAGAIIKFICETTSGQRLIVQASGDRLRTVKEGDEMIIGWDAKHAIVLSA
ncbi:ABC transporter ATP-binding protein [Geomicrobium sediminis]|uniref:Spermidine/putrescine import ATP-binding protein PotA n=1 Tax=Geomicrobium sediminis TaxID=1347788 RepID=A0ABS2PFH1_9BACL|nr:spermidine/putrescine transport system ATP-binding protein [Geomicrobium sediminis]